MEKYRFDQYGNIHKYDADNQAYIFCGYLRGRTEKQAIIDIEKRESYQVKMDGLNKL